ncbi:MAG: response regulator [Crocinitomicaceae bacterium]|jgi:CheY-like chemotaxis protein|nr:response regulator [Crocinitomicaceae bacterium]
MSIKLKSILIIDDNEADNFLHKMVIDKMGITERVDIVNDGVQALEFLKNENQLTPDLIFLDINMPKMDGWEFLEHYQLLDPAQKSKAIILMLTTSENPKDRERALRIEDVKGYEIKPLEQAKIERILDVYFS